MLLEAVQANFRQLSDLLRQLSPADYARPCEDLSGASIGQHMRHIIELYQCLQQQYAAGTVNYDLRKRDLVLESDPDAALAAIKTLSANLSDAEKDLTLSQSIDGCTLSIPTNYSREMLYNLEHAIHHEALIKVALRGLSHIAVPESFGVAAPHDCPPPMCTVTFVPGGGKTVLTSSRDEQTLRPALPPEAYVRNGKTVYFPKDPRAGGTWFAVAGDGTTIVLLNGAREKHQWNPPYARSRGLVVLELIDASSSLEHWEIIDLKGVEPFTIVLFESARLFQLTWDGSQKDVEQRDATRPHLWSSSTLYPEPIRQQRQQWFAEFMRQPAHDPNAIFHFHNDTHPEDRANGLRIDRDGVLKTLSITQVVLDGHSASLNHWDLIENTATRQTFHTA